MTQEEYNRLERNPYRKLFHSIVPKINFITPEIIDYYKIGKYIIELSTNIKNNLIGTIYGITVIKQIGNTYIKDNKKCTVKFNMEDVEKYLKELENE